MKHFERKSALILVLIVLFALSGCRSEKMPAEVQKTFDQFIGYWNTGQFDGIEDVLAEDFEMIESPEFEPRRGIDYFKKLVLNTRTTFPDFKLEVNETIYQKDKIAMIWTVTGTHSGPGEIAPTGRTINGKGISVIHLRDGKVVDEWLGNNNLQWLIQMGYTIVPPSE